MPVEPIFTEIRSLFTHGGDRSIERLSSLYDNIDLLKDSIDDLCHRHLPKSDIESKTVLLKPNWVYHNNSVSDEICLRTHDSFLVATLECLLGMDPKKIIIGDAPIQGCDWAQVVRRPLLSKIDELRRKNGIEIEIKDFRRVVFDKKLNQLSPNRRPLTDYVIFDLGKKSFLEPISYGNQDSFRVTDYDPKRMSLAHGPGLHKYCITRELFSSDVVITLPKVKTHQKTGITNALKILVGVNGDKDFLPHHRMGGTLRGGDCYPGDNIFQHWAERILDGANGFRGRIPYKTLARLSHVFWKLSAPTPEQHLSAAWHGNDTTWRMVMDLNMIATHGQVDGNLASVPRRKIYSLSDGIIGGQGDGPLSPAPLPLGIMALSNHSGLVDVAMARLMGFDPGKIPLLRDTREFSIENKTDLYLNGNKLNDMEALDDFAISADPPPGWVKHLREETPPMNRASISKE